MPLQLELQVLPCALYLLFCLLFLFFFGTGGRCTVPSRNFLRAGQLAPRGHKKTTKCVTGRPIPVPRFGDDITDGPLMNHPILRREGHRGVATFRVRGSGDGGEQGVVLLPILLRRPPLARHLRANLTVRHTQASHPPSGERSHPGPAASRTRRWPGRTIKQCQFLRGNGDKVKEETIRPQQDTRPWRITCLQSCWGGAIGIV